MPALALALAGDIDGSGGALHHDDHITPPSAWHYQGSPPDDVATAEIHGLLYRRHLLKSSAGFLEAKAGDIETSPLSVDMANGSRAKTRMTITSELPTSLLMESASFKTEPLHDSSAGEAELALGTALAVPLMKHRVGRFSAQISTGFDAPIWHDHYLSNEWDTSLHDWGVDIKPLSMRQIARLMFAAVTNVMEHVLGPNFLVHAMVLLALAAIWAPYDKIAEAAVKGVPKLVGGIMSGVAAVATGIYQAGKVVGKGMVKAAKAAGKVFKAVGNAVGDAAHGTVKVIGKGFELLGLGIYHGAVLLGKGLSKIDLGKMWHGLGGALASAGESMSKGFRKFGLWMDGLTPPVLSASLAFVGKAFRSFGKFVGKGFKVVGKGLKAFGKAAWKGMKFVGKGLWKGAKLVGAGLVNLYELLDRAVKATGRGILALGNLARSITGEQLGAALLIAGALGIAAILALHALRKRGKGRNTMTWGSKKRGRAGRRGNPVDARAAALQAAEERKAARERNKKAGMADAPAAAENHHVMPPGSRKTRKKRALTLEDLLAKQRRDINNAYGSDGMYGVEESETNMTPLGKHSLDAAAAAGGAAIMANSMSGPRGRHGNRAATTGHEFAGGDGAEDIQVQPGPVVVGHQSRSGRTPGSRHTQHNAKPHTATPQPIPDLPRRNAEEGSSEHGDTDEVFPGKHGEDKDMRPSDARRTGSNDEPETLAEKHGEDKDMRPSDARRTGSNDEPETLAEKRGGSRENENVEMLPGDVATDEDMQEADDMEMQREHARHIAKQKEHAPNVNHLGTNKAHPSRNQLGRSRREEALARDMRYHNWNLMRVWPNARNETAPGIRRARTNHGDPTHALREAAKKTNEGARVTRVKHESAGRAEFHDDVWSSRAEEFASAKAAHPHEAERFQEEASEDAARSRDHAQRDRAKEVNKMLVNEDLSQNPEKVPSVVPHNNAVLEVAAANREHRANTFGLQTVQNMDDDELEMFKQKQAMNNRDAAGPPVHAHDANRSGHRVSSSNLAFVLPKHSSGRASAFLGMIEDETQAFCSMQSGSAVGDSTLSSLYYIDQDGRPRDFLDPGKLKQALRKITIDSGLARSSFLEPISEQRLRSS